MIKMSADEQSALSPDFAVFTLHKYKKTAKIAVL
jgi:hypothetical protein